MPKPSNNSKPKKARPMTVGPLPPPQPWRSCFRNDLFSGKVALVTGGGTGIGLCIARELASLGATVVIASRNQEKCGEAANEMNNSGVLSGKVVAGPSTNLRSEENIRGLIRHVVETHGSLDLLINNAGGQFISETADISRKGWQAVVETNLQGTFLMCKEAYKQYMKEHGGSIVNITIGFRNGMPGMAHSAASRAAVENMTASLCTEWISSNVRINCVRPGIVFTDSGFKNYGPAGKYFLKKLVRSLPARRLASPEEVASAVTWLLSDGASYVTGATICVDGGGSYSALPLLEVENQAHLPIYGTLPAKAKL